jgi:Na+/H+ antiporter NhaD/arsenite permease-like protein
LGTALFGGLFLATFLSLFLVPILSILVENLAAAVATLFKTQPELATNGQIREVSYRV